MFEQCKFIDGKCPFGGLFKNELHCGEAKQGYSRVQDLKQCPRIKVKKK